MPLTMASNLKQTLVQHRKTKTTTQESKSTNTLVQPRKTPQKHT